MTLPKYIITLLLTLFLLSYKLTAHADINLKFGVYTTNKPSEMVKKFRPILNALEAGMSNQLGEKVRISTQISDSYENGRQAIVHGTVDFSHLGPVSYVLAKKENPNLTILLKESLKGKQLIRGIIAVHRDSLIQTIRGLRGKRFAFGSKTSTTGRYLAQYHLQKNGIYAKDFQIYNYLGRHDNVGIAVASKIDFDAGSLNETTFNKLVNKGYPLRALDHFNVDVSKPWVAREGLEPQIRQSLKDVLLSLNADSSIKRFQKKPLVDGVDTDFENVRKAIESNNLFFK